MSLKRFRAFLLMLLVLGENHNFLFASDPLKLVKCKYKKTHGGKDVYVPENSAPTECVASGPTEGLQCSVLNYKKHFPGACKDIQEDLQSRPPKPPPPLSEVCQPLLTSISLFIVTCENVRSPEAVSLNYTFHLPLCDVESPLEATSVKVDWNTDNDGNFFQAHPICRVFDYAGSNFTVLSPYSEKIQMTYEWMAVGIQDVEDKVNYALNLTVYPSGVQLNYSVTHRNVGIDSMRLVAGAWRSRQIAHFVFLPIQNIDSYLVEATSGQQQTWKFSQKVYNASFEITDIPDSVKGITVSITPDDRAECQRNGYFCSSINVTLPDKDNFNLPQDHAEPPPQPPGANENHLKLIVISCIVVVLLLIIMPAVFLYCRKTSPSSGPGESLEPVVLEELLEPVLCITNLPMSTCSALKQRLLDHRLAMKILKHTTNCISEMKHRRNILIIIHPHMSYLPDWETFCKQVQRIFESSPIWDKIKVISLDDGHGGNRCYPSDVLRNCISGDCDDELVSEFFNFLDGRTFSLADCNFSELSEAHQNGLQHFGPLPQRARSDCSGLSQGEEENLNQDEEENISLLSPREREESDSRQENGRFHPNGISPVNVRLVPEGSVNTGEREDAYPSKTLPKVPGVVSSDETSLKLPHATYSDETSLKLPHATYSDETSPKVPTFSDETSPKLPHATHSDETSPKHLHATYSDEMSPKIPHATYLEETSPKVSAYLDETHPTVLTGSDETSPKVPTYSDEMFAEVPFHSTETFPEDQSVPGSEVGYADSFLSNRIRTLSESDPEPIADHVFYRSGDENTDSCPSNRNRNSPELDLKSTADSVHYRSGDENTDSFRSNRTRLLSESDTEPIAGSVFYRSGEENTDSFPSNRTRLLSESDLKSTADGVLCRGGVENNYHSPPRSTAGLSGDICHRSGVENIDSFPCEDSTRSPESYHASGINSRLFPMGNTRMVSEADPVPTVGDASQRNGDEDSYSPQVCGPDEYMTFLSNSSNGQRIGQGMLNESDGNSVCESAGREWDSRRLAEGDSPAIHSKAAPSACVVCGPEEFGSLQSSMNPGAENGMTSSLMPVPVPVELGLPQTHHGDSQLQAGAMSSTIPPQDKNPNLFSQLFQQGYFDSNAYVGELIGRGSDTTSDINRENSSQRYDGEWSDGERLFCPDFRQLDDDDDDDENYMSDECQK